MSEITKYSVVCCNVLAIQTGLIYISKLYQEKKADQIESVFYELYGSYIESGAQINIREEEFVAAFRRKLNSYGFKTSVLNGEPNVVVIYYNDSQNQQIKKIVESNHLTIQYTSFMSPKQASMVFRV